MPFVPSGDIEYGGIQIVTVGDSPRETDPIEDKVALDLIRNLEMSAGGRAFVDKEGNFHYDSRYGRSPC